MAIDLNIEAMTLPEGFCPSNYQDWLDAIAQYLRVQFPSNYAKLNTGATTPSIDDRLFPWNRLGGGDPNAPDGIYNFISGVWCLQHSVPASSGVRRFFVGSDITTFDGGSSGSVSDISGPMWEEDTSMRKRFPIGLDPDGGASYNAPLIAGGEENHELTVAELPAHNHPIVTQYPIITLSHQYDGQGGNHIGDSTRGAPDPTIGNTGGGGAHNNMPPYLTGYWIKRTARKYYTIPG